MEEYLREDGGKEFLPVSNLGDSLRQEYDEFSDEQIETAVEVMEQRYGEDTFISPEDVELEEVYNDAVEIDIEDVEDTPIYADPSAGDGEHLCITWGNLGDDETPPEGRAQTGSGEDVFGIR